jgi:L-2-hydroxyglutarate oxidase LhgO
MLCILPPSFAAVTLNIKILKGTITPYEYAIALAENAVDNGVELRIRREVVAIQKEGDMYQLQIKVRMYDNIFTIS